MTCGPEMFIPINILQRKVQTSRQGSAPSCRHGGDTLCRFAAHHRLHAAPCPRRGDQNRV